MECVPQWQAEQWAVILTAAGAAVAAAIQAWRTSQWQRTHNGHATCTYRMQAPLPEELSTPQKRLRRGRRKLEHRKP